MKEFLECNKIFFEILSYVIIGITGIIISYLQLAEYRKQSKMQKSIRQPLFRIAYKIHKILSEDHYDTESFEIHNDGNPFKWFGSDILTFYKVRRSSYEDNDKNKVTLYFPVNGYFFAISQSGSITGKLVEGISRGNNREFGRVYNEFVNYKKNGEYIFIDRIHLIKMEYIDIDNEKHISYYQNRDEINKKDYEDVLQQSKNIFDHKIFDIEKINLDIIKDYF